MIEHVEVFAYPWGSWRERWTFAHVAGNGQKQTSRKRYVTKWNAKRAARKLYPGLPITEDPH
jgi:hypothetical protein